MLNNNPIIQFQNWFEDAKNDRDIIHPNAMTLSTIGLDGYPDSRIVLLKALDEQGFSFFTNYNSIKGQQLAQSMRGGLLFFWEKLGRQVRVQGNIESATEAESDSYFASRPRLSPIGACVSAQSQELTSKMALEKAVEEFEASYHQQPIPRPSHWGGYRLIPHKIEFWIERPYRLHDRFEYTRTGSDWTVRQLFP
jgi:pyridoxamine 5'-phosphate oxidase